jgi:gliding motility-associated-like protein
VPASFYFFIFSLNYLGLKLLCYNFVAKYMRTVRISILVSLLFLLVISSKCLAQCVLINELMINGPGSCDGGCNPNTEEWTELYNDCSTPVNIGCFVLTDGEFTVTIPSGTILAPYDYYVIGSNNSGGPVDLNLATCNCTSGTLVGTYSNTNEQAILVNASGVIQDAVYWGVGDFPVSITSTSVGSCTPVSINISSPGGNFVQLATGGANGCTMARDCDSNPTWVQRCSTAVSINSSNGSVIPKFSASDSTICPGTCISFTDLTTGNPTTWNWTFAGASSATVSSSAKNPGNVCYPNPGNFPVTLAANTICGNITVSMPAFIKVTALPIPTITPLGSLNFCTGGSVVLQSSLASAYQWLLNGTAITGATQQQYTASIAGNYSVKISEGVCNATSLPIGVVVSPKPTATFTLSGDSVLCSGGNASLIAATGFSSYQWLVNGTIMPSETNPTLLVSGIGSYSVIVSNSGGCKDTSSAQSISLISGYSVTISTADSVLCEGQSTTLFLTSTYPSLLWSTGQSTTSISVSNSGLYSVDVFNASGCYGKDTIRIEVTTLPLVFAGNDTIGDCSNGIELRGKGIGSLIQWQPLKGLSDPFILNPIAKPNETTLYTLTIQDKDCSAQDEVMVSVDCGVVYIPNSFSPNGDGNNDVFYVIGNNVVEYELLIFNRWGEIIFESNSITQGWNGNYLNQAEPAGVYVYKIKAINPEQKSLLAEGKNYGVIVLIR